MSSSLNSNRFKRNDELILAVFYDILWADGVYCPKCKSSNIKLCNKRKILKKYYCLDCSFFFNDFTDTVLEKKSITISEILYIFINFENKSVDEISYDLNQDKEIISSYIKKFKEKSF